MYILEKIKNPDATLHLTELELSINKYIYNNRNEIGSIKIRDIAWACYCSTAAVNRYTKKFGVSGYKEFKYRLITELSDLNLSLGPPILANMAKCTSYVTEYDTSDFSRQLKQFKDKRTLVVGCGTTLVAAMYLCKRLCNLGFDATYMSGLESSTIDSDIFDTVVFVSVTGVESFLLSVADELEKRVILMAITQQNSVLFNAVDYAVGFPKIFYLDEKNTSDNQLLPILFINKIAEEIYGM